MMQPLILLFINVEQRAEGAFIQLFLCTLLDGGPLVAADPAALISLSEAMAKATEMVSGR